VTDFRDYAADEVLRDGGSIHIRAIRPQDKALLQEAFSRLSPRSVHFRFFGAKRRLSEEELARFTELDFVRNVGLVGTLRDDGGEHIIGVGRYMSTAENRAEVAFAVSDEHQGRGIGTALLEHLASIARANGIRELEADVLGENNQMLRVFRKSGFVATRSIEAGVVHLKFPTDETAEFLSASLEREIAASAGSVRHLLRPESIAVFGAAANSDSMGSVLLANLRRGGFTGAIHPIHPTSKEVGGLAAFATVGAIGHPVELALIDLPAAEVSAAVADCARAGVRAVAVLSAGFADLSEAGRGAQHELVELVRHSGLRLLGPKSLGVVNTDAQVRLCAIVAHGEPRPGNVAISVQSSGLAAAILDFAAGRSLGLSSFVSLGNKADVSGNDVLSYWLSDERTAVIALYLESFGNPRRFAQIAPRVARAKPIVALKAGWRHGGREESIGVRATIDGAVDALFQQAGVIRSETIEEFFDVLTLLSCQPLPRGPRVAVVTNSYGPGLLLADALAARGLELALLDPGTADALARQLGREAKMESINPVDLGEGSAAEGYEQALAVVAADACVDAVIAVYVPSLAASMEEVATAIARGAGAVAAEKTVLTVFISAHEAPQALHGGLRGRLPAYSFPENAALALSAAEHYARWRSRARGRAVELDRTAAGVVRAIVERARGGSERSAWLDARDFAAVLRAADIPCAEPVVVTPDEAGELAETIGYPLAAKAIAAGLHRRSEVGCIVLGLDSRPAVERGVETLRQRTKALGLALEGVLLQREYGGGIEAIVAVSADTQFGPTIVCGLGGILVEVVRDLAVRLPPITDLDAAAMVRELRATRLLDGYRGVGPGDRGALEAILTRVSALVEIVPEIVELELSPIKILAPGEGAVVLGGRLRV